MMWWPTAPAKTAVRNVSTGVHAVGVHWNERYGGLGVQSPACKEANQVSSKLGALIILKSFLGRELNYSHETPQESVYTGPETIVDAPVVLATPGIEIEEP